MDQQSIGKVKFFKPDEDYGIIICDGQDVYCHKSDFKEIGLTTLTRGQKVEFFMESGPKGLIAKSVVLQ